MSHDQNLSDPNPNNKSNTSSIKIQLKTLKKCPKRNTSGTVFHKLKLKGGGGGGGDVWLFDITVISIKFYNFIYLPSP